MFKRDRAHDDRRSVGSHEKMMSALGRASGNIKNPVTPISKPFKSKSYGKPLGDIEDAEIVEEHHG
jgi:hypothetical protein